MIHPHSSTLQRLADGLLPADEAATTRAHLDECPDCRQRAEREHLLSESLRNLGLDRPSASFDRAVLDAVLPSRSVPARETPQLRRYAGLLALCALTLLVVLLSPEKQEPSASSWTLPVREWIATGTTAVTEIFSSVARRIPAPAHNGSTSGSNVVEILSLALLALGAFAALDHFLGPHLRRER